MQKNKTSNTHVFVSNFLALLLAGTVCLFAQACSDTTPSLDGDGAGGSQAAVTQPENEGEEGGHGGHDEGEPMEVAVADIGGSKVKIVQFGHWKAGLEGAAELELLESKEPLNSIRAWVGNEQADGVVKAKADKESDTQYHMHIELPSEFGDDSLLWIEIESAGGERIKKGFAFEKE